MRWKCLIRFQIDIFWIDLMNRQCFESLGPFCLGIHINDENVASIGKGPGGWTRPRTNLPRAVVEHSFRRSVGHEPTLCALTEIFGATTLRYRTPTLESNPECSRPYPEFADAPYPSRQLRDTVECARRNSETGQRYSSKASHAEPRRDTPYDAWHIPTVWCHRMAIIDDPAYWRSSLPSDFPWTQSKFEGWPRCRSFTGCVGPHAFRGHTHGKSGEAR